MVPWSRIAAFARRVAASRPIEWRFAAAAWMGAPAIDGALRLGGLDRTLRWIEALSPVPTSTDRPEALSIERASSLVDRVYRLHVLPGTCLRKSLLQYWLHRRAGTPVRFVVGVRRGDKRADASLDAHAWVEPLDAPQGQAYERLLVREAQAPGGQAPARRSR